MALNRYVFCDIDGTLLQAPQAGRSAFGETFAEVFGIPVDMGHINFAGATDIRVLSQLMRENDISEQNDLVNRFFDRFPFFLKEKLKATPPHVFAGVIPFLERISADWSLGLITGNIQACAQIKVRAAGIDSYFGPVGGFGDDHGDRNHMAALALKRAHFPSPVYLLGDTPSDIEAARSNGMVAVGVCNGSFTRAQLEDVGADLILESFEDTSDFFKVLES